MSLAEGCERQEVVPTDVNMPTSVENTPTTTTLTEPGINDLKLSVNLLNHGNAKTDSPLPDSSLPSSSPASANSVNGVSGKVVSFSANSSNPNIAYVKTVIKAGKDAQKVLLTPYRTKDGSIARYILPKTVAPSKGNPVWISPGATGVVKMSTVQSGGFVVSQSQFPKTQLGRSFVIHSNSGQTSVRPTSILKNAPEMAQRVKPITGKLKQIEPKSLMALTSSQMVLKQLPPASSPLAPSSKGYDSKIVSIAGGNVPADVTLTSVSLPPVSPVSTASKPHDVPVLTPLDLPPATTLLPDTELKVTSQLPEESALNENAELDTSECGLKCFQDYVEPADVEMKSPSLLSNVANNTHESSISITENRKIELSKESLCVPAKVPESKSVSLGQPQLLNSVSDRKPNLKVGADSVLEAMKQNMDKGFLRLPTDVKISSIKLSQGNIEMNCGSEKLSNETRLETREDASVKNSGELVSPRDDNLTRESSTQITNGSAVGSVTLPHRFQVTPTIVPIKHGLMVKELCKEASLQERARKRKAPLLKDAATRKTIAVKRLELLPGASDFDPLEVIQWDDSSAVGVMPGSEIKFTMNKFGGLQLFDSYRSYDNFSKLSILADYSMREKRVDDICKCVQCQCYGLVAEFMDEKYCSNLCKEEYTTKMALSKKRESSLSEDENTRKKRRLLELALQVKVTTEDGKVEIKTEVEEQSQPECTSEVLMSEPLIAAGDVSSEENRTEADLTNCSLRGTDSSVGTVKHETSTPAHSKTSTPQSSKALSPQSSPILPTPGPQLIDKLKKLKEDKQIKKKIVNNSLLMKKAYFLNKTSIVAAKFDNKKIPDSSSKLDKGEKPEKTMKKPLKEINDVVSKSIPEQPVPSNSLFDVSQPIKEEKLEVRAFNWHDHLEKTQSSPAWMRLFRNPFPTDYNMFKVGHRLEAIDPQRQSLFCVASVAEVKGYRIKIHFDRFSRAHDFWVNADSPNIFPCGFCDKYGIELQVPWCTNAEFSWTNYLSLINAKPAPSRCFANTQNNTGLANLFRVGMKLEAVDRKNSYLVCVASVAAVLNDRILVHFDSWDSVYDYWAELTSAHIHPVGWCERNQHQLTPPNGWKKRSFSWNRYLEETGTVAAPEAAFMPRPSIKFKKGTKLEAVDPKAPHLVRPATVRQVSPYEVLVVFDGFPDHFGCWFDDDHPDLHPVGWAEFTGHTLAPLPSAADIERKTCETGGCVGDGHARGLDHESHASQVDCPYLEDNSDLIPDRLKEKPIPIDRKSLRRSIQESFKKVRESIEQQASTEKNEDWETPVKREVEEVEEDEEEDEDEDEEEEEEEEADEGRREGILEPMPTDSPPNVSEVVKWSPLDVSRYALSISGIHTTIFMDNDIDGESFLMLEEEDIVSHLRFTKSTASKIFFSIAALRVKVI